MSQALPNLDLVIAATPLWAPVLRYVSARRRGFDSVDDWRALDRVQHLRSRVSEGYRAVADADSVTANSAVAAEILGPIGAQTVIVPNGVDIARFSNASSPAPTPLPTLPFAVYVGVIQDRLDVDLLCQVAETVDMPVVVAGDGDESILAKLRDHGITTLGKIDHALIPGLLRSAAVGIIPHRVTALTASMDPLKLLEYLAAGLPVVTTPVANVAVSASVRIAGDPIAFAEEMVRVARIRGDGPRRPDPAVMDRDWSSQARRLLEVHLPGEEFRSRQRD